MEDKKVKLHIGCGQDYREGWVNIDASPKVKTDLCIDVEKGLPFADNSVDHIYCSMFLEHVDDPVKVIEEFYRVLKHDGIFEFILPFADSIFSAYSLPHKNFFIPRSFEIFVLGYKRHSLYNHEVNALFRKKRFRIKLIYFDIWFPEFFQYLLPFFNVFDCFEGVLIAVKDGVKIR